MSSPKPTIKSANVNPAFREGGRVVEELKTLYYSRLLAIEREYSFAKLCGFPEILEAELEAKPLVLLLGASNFPFPPFLTPSLGKVRIRVYEMLC